MKNEVVIFSREQAEYYHFIKTGELTIQINHSIL